MTSLAWGDLRPDDAGLVPAIVQDPDTRRVLMVAYMSAEAFAATVETGEVHFWSRSRGRLWRKGETSGNTLRLVGLSPDCDGDALLVFAVPAGPVCHTGTHSCFGGQPGPDQGFASLESLWETVDERARTRPPGSYTSSLIEGGSDATLRKVGEEALEVVMAAKDHAAGAVDDRRVAEEAADLVYHLLVALAERGIEPRALLEVLVERRG